MTKVSAPEPAPERPGSTTVGLSCDCEVCGEKFASKTKLFKHLEKHGVEGMNTKPLKVVLLVGWLSDVMEDKDVFLVDKMNDQNYTDDETEKIEQHLWRAIYAVDHKLDSIGEIKHVVERPKGFSRGTSCMQRSSLLLGTEPSCHGCCDTFCFQAKRWLGSGGDSEWMTLVNGHLPSSIRVIFRQTLSTAAAAELHAENNCSQRRYEFLLPLRLVMPDELTTHPTEPIVRRQRIRSTIMDRDFPMDTPEGQARILFFRNLKRVLKLFAEDGRKSYHNFASGGAVPEESTAMRRIDRIYHREIVKLGEEPWVVFSCCGDALMRGQFRRMLGLTIGVIRGWLPEEYLQAVMRKDTIADVPAVPGWGMYIAECRYAFWEAKYTEERCDPRRVEGADESGLNEWTNEVQNHIAKLGERVGDEWMETLERDCRAAWAKYDALRQLHRRSVEEMAQRFEEDFGVRYVDSRWAVAAAVADGESDAASTASGEEENRAKRAKNDNTPEPVTVEMKVEEEEQAPPDGKKSKGKGKDKGGKNGKNGKNGKKAEAKPPAAAESAPVVEEVKPELPPHDPATEYCHSSQYHSINRPPAALASSATAAITLPLFQEVLRLLHEVESSGQWPLSSTGRQKVIADKTLVENGGYGGSFSVGCLPKHMAQPRASKQFPELMKACFRLEAALCPGRAPSSTIAINRHAQFMPHRDSGAGNGQSTSLIVALGDFVGGEIVVEGVASDIRYQPLEFDGWAQRHWTLPFVGERYSLVWFTPLGVEEADLYWWKDGRIE